MEKENKVEVAVGSISPPQVWTDLDLQCSEFPQPTFVIPGLVPEGVTILAGKPKVGKSLLTYNLGLSVAGGQSAFGVIPVNQGEVLYLALEEIPSRLKAKIAKMRGATAPTNRIHFAFHWPRVDEGGLERLEEWLKDHSGVKFVVIDTFARFRSWKASHAGYDRDYGAVSMIKKLADEKAIAIVLINHLRKASAQDQMDLVMGSVGITGAADSVMILTRERLGSQSELFVSGRDIEEASLALQFNSDCLAWTIIGQAGEYRISRERQEVFQLLKSADGPIKLGQIASDLGKKRPIVHKHLQALVKCGSVEQPRYGEYQIRKTGESGETGENVAILQ